MENGILDPAEIRPISQNAVSPDPREASTHLARVVAITAVIGRWKKRTLGRGTPRKHQVLSAGRRRRQSPQRQRSSEPGNRAQMKEKKKTSRVRPLELDELKAKTNTVSST